MFYIYFLIQRTHLNWRELGEAVNRDHATAIYYYNKVKYESQMYDDMKKMKREIGALIIDIWMDRL